MRASPAWIGRPMWRHLFDGTSTSPSIKHSHDSTNQLLRITRFPASEELMTTEFVIRRVGVVGLGHMGHAFAVNLVEDGHQVFVYDRDPKRTAALSGARAAAQLADLAACDVVVTSLPDDDALAGWHSGPRAWWAFSPQVRSTFPRARSARGFPGVSPRNMRAIVRIISPHRCSGTRTSRGNGSSSCSPQADPRHWRRSVHCSSVSASNSL